MSVGGPSDRQVKEAREAGVPSAGRTVGPTLKNGSSNQITFENVSRFYGQVLGVNRISLSIPPGITSLVGPNGSGKTTLMNMMTGLVRPTEGRIDILGIKPTEP